MTALDFFLIALPPAFRAWLRDPATRVVAARGIVEAVRSALAVHGLRLRDVLELLEEADRRGGGPS